MWTSALHTFCGNLPVCATIGSFLIGLAILAALFLPQLLDFFIHTELVLHQGGKTFELWRKPPVTPQTKVYFFIMKNHTDFLKGIKPRFSQIGPYVYDEVWEKININWNNNGTISYEPSKRFHFNRAASFGDETDRIRLINIPYLTAAHHMKNSAMGFAVNMFLQRTFVFRTVKEYLWGYSNFLLSIGKITLPAEHVMPFDQFGLFIGRNTTTEGVFTAHTGKGSIQNYTILNRWNGLDKLRYWKNDRCNQLNGTDGTAFPPDITRNTTLYLFNPEMCRSLPLVYHEDVMVDGVKAYRFKPPKNLFDSVEQNPDNKCFCTEESHCPKQGLFEISACKFGAPIALSWPHFLHGDPQLLQDSEGLNPNSSRHEFYLDIQPKMGLAMSAKVRVQVNFIASGIEHLTGVRDYVIPLIWFESGIDSLPHHVTHKLQMVTKLLDLAVFLLPGFLAGLGGIFVICVGYHIRKQRVNNNSKKVEIAQVHKEFQKSSFGKVDQNKETIDNHCKTVNTPLQFKADFSEVTIDSSDIQQIV